MLKIFIHLALLLLFFLPVTATAAQPEKACEFLSERLGKKVNLTGAEIQFGPSSFLEQNTGMELAFSEVFAEALAASLSNRGALISLEEKGENPLRLLGHYQLSKDQIQITVRIQQMGLSGNSDLAVAQTSIDRDDLQEVLLQSDLGDLTNSLIKKLENNLPRFKGVISVEQPRPGMKGQPTLQFGTELKKRLEQSVSNSEFFSAFSIGTKRNTYHLQPRYSRIDKSMRVELQLFTPDNKPAAVAKVDLLLNQIPKELLALVDDRDLSVCIEYKQRDRRDVKTGSVEADSLVDGISAILSRYGTESSACEDNSDMQGIRIVASMRLTEKRTRDGYGFMRGDLKMKILNSKNKVISTLNSRNKVSLSGGDDGVVENLIEKMFDDAFQEKLAAQILSK